MSYEVLKTMDVRDADGKVVVANIIDNKKIEGAAWSSKNTMDRLCPSFAESGSVVACEPIEGYPLEIISTINEKADDSKWESIKLTQCGKNLIGYDNYSGVQATSRTAECTDGVHKINIYGPLTTTYVIANADAYKKGGYLVPGTYVFSINQKSTGKLFTGCYAAVLLEDGTTINLPDGAAVTLTQSGTVSGIRCASTHIEGGTYITVTVQIEAGSVATSYEPYRNSSEWTINFGDLYDGYSTYHVYFGSYNWLTGVLDSGEHGLYQHNLKDNSFTIINESTYVPTIVRNIPALTGTNAFYSDCGNTTVKGKADPVKIINKLTNAIISLGGYI